MEARLFVPVVGIAIAALAAVGVGLAQSGASGDAVTADQIVNRAQVLRITDSPHVNAVALPSALPPSLDFLQAVRTAADASEIHFQQAGLYVVVCSGVAIDSACEAETANILRTETIDGVTVRAAQVVSEDATAKLPATEDPTAIEDFWRTVEFQLGAPDWLRSFE